MLRSARSHRPSSPRRPTRLVGLRSLVAGLIAAGIAVAGLAFAAPAAAEEVPQDVSSIEIEVVDCATYGGGLGAVRYRIEDPATGYHDLVTITDASDTVVHDAVYVDDTEFEAEVPLAPGEYTIYYVATGEPNPRYTETQTVTIGACPDLDLTVTPSCSTGADGTASVAFSGLIAGEEYSYFLEGIGVSTFDSFVAAAPTEDVVLEDLPPGNYYVYVEWDGDGLMADWRAFAVDPCQPELAVTVAQCTAIGGDASVEVVASDLVEGVVYTVTGPDGGTKQVTGDASGTATLSFASLEPGTDATVSIAGTWSVEAPYEEPPFIGNGGNFTPIDTVELYAEADVSAEPCAAVLPATGADGAGTLAVGGVLLGLGGLLLIAIRRRAVTPD